MLVVGTIGLDSVKTPFGEVKNILGGAGTYASFAASFFTNVNMVSTIGKDFPKEHIDLLQSRKIDLEGVKKSATTFKWKGYYQYDMNEAHTVSTKIGGLKSFKPELPEKYKEEKYVFLGNFDPSIQLSVLKQLKNPEFVALDTMNFWITSKRNQLLDVLRKVNTLIINDAEARQLFETPNLVKAAKSALKYGPEAVIIKKGEHGALLFTDSKYFAAPAYPLENIIDPTGSGDCFAGSFTGYLEKTKDLSHSNLRKAVIIGSVIASYNAEGFSLEVLKDLSQQDIENRYKEMKELRDF